MIVQHREAVIAVMDTRGKQVRIVLTSLLVLDSLAHKKVSGNSIFDCGCCAEKEFTTICAVRNE